jgi:hypothetical protein
MRNPHTGLQSLVLALCATAALGLTGCSDHHDATLPPPPTTQPPDTGPATTVLKPLRSAAPPSPTDPITAEIERARLAEERRLREQFPENRCSVAQPNTVPAEATQQCSGTAGWRKLQWIDRTDGSLMVIEHWLGDAWVTVFTGPSCVGTITQDDARTLTRIGVPAALAATWGAQPSRCIA